MARLGALWQLYLFYGLIVGIGLSSVDVLALTTTARWFANKRGIMTGIVKIGTGAGQLTVPLVASMLITNYGWRNAYLIIGVAVLLVLVAIAQLLRPEPNHMAPLSAHGRETSEDSPAVPEGGLSLSQTLHTKQFWTISAVNLVIVFCMLIIMVHIVPHARDRGISTTKAAGVLSTIGGVSMAGRFITGIAIDRIGSKRAMVFCFVLLIAGLLWLQIAREMWMLYVFAVIYGVAHGSYFTTISPMVAEFFGIIAHGVLFGIIAFSGTVGGAIGPILGRYIFDLTARYSLAFWLCTAMSALGLVLLLSLEPVEKRRWDAHV
jgi:MFS family permease